MAKHSLRYDRREFEEKVDSLLSFLQILPKDIAQYRLACIHRSVLNESHQGYHASNERLEYL